MKASVIILNWNGADMLRRYLPSVVQYTTNSNTEIVVVDNGSTDDSLHVLHSSFPSVKTLVFDHNYGFAEGYNKAIAQTNAEYTILLNSDVEVTEGWLTHLTDYLDANPDVAAVQPKVRSWLRKTHFEHAGAAGGFIDKWCYPYCRGRILDYVEEDKGQYDTPIDIFWTTGACMCVRTEVYKQLGGLDTQFFAHMEEIDLCWRMNSRGYRLSCVPSSIIFHLGGGALGYENPKKTYLNFRNCLLMIYKNMPAKRLCIVMLVRFVLDYIASLHLLLIGKPQNAWAVIKARIDYHKLCRTKYFRLHRENNIKKAVVSYPSKISNSSILMDYYLRHKRTF